MWVCVEESSKFAYDWTIQWQEKSLDVLSAGVVNERVNERVEQIQGGEMDDSVVKRESFLPSYQGGPRCYYSEILSICAF